MVAESLKRFGLKRLLVGHICLKQLSGWKKRQGNEAKIPLEDSCPDKTQQQRACDIRQPEQEKTQRSNGPGTAQHQHGLLDGKFSKFASGPATS